MPIASYRAIVAIEWVLRFVELYSQATSAQTTMFTMEFCVALYSYAQIGSSYIIFVLLPYHATAYNLILSSKGNVNSII